MYAWRVHEYGEPQEVLQWESCDKPSADGIAAVVKVEAVGLNFADLLSIKGQYQVKMPLPFVPGIEASGVVVEATEECRLEVGQRVTTTQLSGSMGEYMLAMDSSAFVLPDAMSYAQGAAFLVTYQTAYFALAYRARLQEGETLLVHAGAGGVGTASIQLGKAMGATVIATAGSDEKLEICKRCGADHVINYRQQEFRKIVKSLTDGRGADVILDPVGGDVFAQSLRCTAWEGRLVVIGFASGAIPEFSANRVLLKNMAVTGLYWGNYLMQNPALVHETHDKLCALFEAGAIDPVLFGDYSLQQLPEALEALGSRASYGKIVLSQSD